jgi:hypothetical protein
VENADAWSASAAGGPLMFGTTPKAPRCHSCARPMQLSRRTSRYGGLPDLYSFCCVACDEWHVEEGGPVKFTELHA